MLPFRKPERARGRRHFAEGIRDDLLTQLSKVAAFKVISRTSMMRYADSTLSIRRLPRSLGLRWCWRVPCSLPAIRSGSMCG
ncbi:MAG: hypothetical protein IPH76_17915 [Xanthomonadales bacterium]|nr:hypothetical protein [Xanthomonadales bacterium]